MELASDAELRVRSSAWTTFDPLRGNGHEGNGGVERVDAEVFLSTAESPKGPAIIEARASAKRGRCIAFRAGSTEARWKLRGHGPRTFLALVRAISLVRI